jgi:hypothetical protein
MEWGSQSQSVRAQEVALFQQATPMPRFRMASTDLAWQTLTSSNIPAAPIVVQDLLVSSLLCSSVLAVTDGLTTCSLPSPDLQWANSIRRPLPKTRYLVAGKGFVMLPLLVAEPRYSRLKELKSRERKHKHIAHLSKIGVCFEKGHNYVRK